RALRVPPLLVPAGCSAGRDGPAPPVTLTAELVTPVDIDLRWTGTDPEPAARTVEFATEPAGPWTILGFLPPDRRTYRHPDLMPQTSFFYRVRPVHGPATAPVPLRLAAPSFDVSAPEDLDWAAPRTLPRTSARPVPGGAPTGLRVSVRSRDAVLVTWEDNAADEEGYLIEVRPEGAADWTVATVLDPDITSVGVTALDVERTAQLRLRAYRFGTPSNTAHRTTGGSLDG
ncbi:fibronectin type III domain-containing protein, partial [Actinoplanes sp. NPDC048791]|uniref:fibronectin type III domain-containing protein n=1 Tax=Actinoplanes sp. NPDC048791 TaxID=3154623 RepID=UPI0033FCF3E5